MKTLYIYNDIGKRAALQILSKIDRFAGLGPFPPARCGEVAGLIKHRFPMEDHREAIKTFVSKKSTRAIKRALEHSASLSSAIIQSSR